MVVGVEVGVTPGVVVVGGVEGVGDTIEVGVESGSEGGAGSPVGEGEGDPKGGGAGSPVGGRATIFWSKIPNCGRPPNRLLKAGST